MHWIVGWSSVLDVSNALDILDDLDVLELCLSLTGPHHADPMSSGINLIFFSFKKLRCKDTWMNVLDFWIVGLFGIEVQTEARSLAVSPLLSSLYPPPSPCTTASRSNTHVYDSSHLLPFLFLLLKCIVQVAACETPDLYYWWGCQLIMGRRWWQARLLGLCDCIHYHSSPHIFLFLFSISFLCFFCSSGRRRRRRKGYVLPQCPVNW